MTTRTGDEKIEYRDYAAIIGLVLFALLLLPVLALLGLVLQFAFVVVAPLLLIAALVYAFVSPVESE